MCLYPHNHYDHYSGDCVQYQARLDGGCVGADSPITQWGDYDGNLTEAGKKSLHQAST